MAVPVPVALDQLLVKQVAINGTPMPSEPWVNILSGATAVDNPNFEVNGLVVGSTDVTITGAPPSPPFVQVVTDANFDFTALPGGNTTAWQSFIYFQNLTTVRTLTLPASPFLGQQITMCTDNSCSSSHPLDMAPSGNTYIYQTVAGLSTNGGFTQLVMEHHYGSATWTWNGAVWSLTAWVFGSGSP